MVDVDASLIFLLAAYRFFRPSKKLSIIPRPPWYSPSHPLVGHPLGALEFCFFHKKLY